MRIDPKHAYSNPAYRGPATGAPTPLLRFLTALQRWFRFWAWLLAAAIGLAAIGVFPSAISVIAMMGFFWVPIVTLVLWGRLLDETMHPRSNIEDGCR